MAKAKYTDPHTQIRNDVLLNLTRVKLKRIEYYRFLFVLFRETFGRKRQKGKELGKYMDWDSKPFRDNGLHRRTISRCKADLLKLRVIRSKHGRIGFNWHFEQWKTEWYVPPIVPQGRQKKCPTGETCPTGDTECPTGDNTCPTGETSNAVDEHNHADPQGLKKGKKGKKLYSALFMRFWDAYPKKKDKHRSAIAFAKAIELTTIDSILEALDFYLKDLPRMKKDALRQGHPEHQFVKGGEAWLNSRPWDEDGATEGSREEAFVKNIQDQAKEMEAMGHKPEEIKAFIDMQMKKYHNKKENI